MSDTTADRLTCAISHRRTSAHGWPIEVEPVSRIQRRVTRTFGWGFYMVLWVAAILAVAGVLGSAG